MPVASASDFNSEADYRTEGAAFPGYSGSGNAAFAELQAYYPSEQERLASLLAELQYPAANDAVTVSITPVSAHYEEVVAERALVDNPDETLVVTNNTEDRLYKRLRARLGQLGLKGRFSSLLAVGDLAKSKILNLKNVDKKSKEKFLARYQDLEHHLSEHRWGIRVSVCYAASMSCFTMIGSSTLSAGLIEFLIALTMSSTSNIFAQQWFALQKVPAQLIKKVLSMVTDKELTDKDLPNLTRASQWFVTWAGSCAMAVLTMTLSGHDAGLITAMWLGAINNTQIWDATIERWASRGRIGVVGVAGYNFLQAAAGVVGEFLSYSGVDAAQVGMGFITVAGLSYLISGERFEKTSARLRALLVLQKRKANKRVDACVTALSGGFFGRRTVPH